MWLDIKSLVLPVGLPLDILLWDIPSSTPGEVESYLSYTVTLYLTAWEHRHRGSSLMVVSVVDALTWKGKFNIWWDLLVMWPVYPMIPTRLWVWVLVVLPWNLPCWKYCGIETPTSHLWWVLWKLEFLIPRFLQSQLSCCTIRMGWISILW